MEMQGTGSRGCGAPKDMGKQDKGAAGTWGTWGCGKPRNMGCRDLGTWGLGAKETEGRGITRAWGHKVGWQRGPGDTRDMHRVNVEDLKTQGRENMGMWGSRKPEQGGYEDIGVQGQGYMRAWSTGVMGTPSGSRGSQKAEMTAEGAAVSPPSPSPGTGARAIYSTRAHWDTGSRGLPSPPLLPRPLCIPPEAHRSCPEGVNPTQGAAPPVTPLASDVIVFLALCPAGTARGPGAGQAGRG